MTHRRSETIRQKIEEIKLLLPKVTAGPWRSWIEGRDGNVGESFIATFEQDIYFHGPVNDDDQKFDHRGGIRKSDLDFIAAARNLLPELIDEFEKLLDDRNGTSSKA